MSVLKNVQNEVSPEFYRKIFSVISFLFVIGIIFSGCQTSGESYSDIELQWEIEPDPPKVGMAVINILLTDSTGQLIRNADIELEGNMSHPGMQPVITNAEEISEGVYSAKFEFTMGGDWFILINSKLADERIVERQIDIPGVSSQ
jgi:hypothetical protein